MPDRETLIRALRCVVNAETETKEECRRKRCPYVDNDFDDCIAAVCVDALELLEGPPQKKERQFISATSFYSEGRNCINKDIIAIIAPHESCGIKGTALHLKGAGGGYEAGTVMVVQEPIEEILAQMGEEQ